MDLSLLTIPTVMTFVLILTRISGLFLVAPVLNHSAVPPMIKVGVALTMSLILFPLHAGAKTYVAPTDLIQFAVMATQELILGMLIGFAADLVFTGMRLAGEYVGVQTGLTMANVLDPGTAVVSSLIGQFYYLFGLMVFLTLNMHHTLILALNKSFQYMPLGQFFASPNRIVERFLVMGSDMFVVGLLLAMPVMGILLVTEMALSFVAKVMPQMNIFIVGIPLKIWVGMFVLMISLPVMAEFLSGHYSTLAERLMGLYKI